MDVLFLEWNVMQLFDKAADFSGELHAAAEAGTRLLSQELPGLVLTVSSSLFSISLFESSEMCRLHV
jgi:hypothetical protein